MSPRFRYLGAGAADDLGDRLPGIVTSELVNSGHFVVVARQEAVEALTQTINRVAARDYIEAHPGATINISQTINTTLVDADLKELSVLQAELRSQMIALGVDYVVYGRYYDAPGDQLRVEIYGLDVEAATLQGAEPVHAPRVAIENAVHDAAGRLAARIRRVIDERRKGRRLALAVLPFQSMERESRWARYSSGLTEELMIALQNARELQLLDRSRTRRYRDADQDTLDLAALGRELQVDLFLLGQFSVTEATQQVRVFARLVSAADEEVLQSFKVVGGMDDDTQARLAQEIFDKLEIRPAAVSEVRSVHTENVSARDYVRIGLHYFDEGALDKALDNFRAAVKLDPQFVEAHYHLGMLLLQLKDYPESLRHFEAALGAARDLSFGAELWRFNAGSIIWTRPLCADGYIYIGTEAGILCAVARDTGELQWRSDVSEPITKTPALHAAAIVVAAEKQAFGIARETGQVLWAVELPGEVTADVALDDDVAILTTAVKADDEWVRSTLQAVDVITGAARWRRDWTGRVSPPLAQRGRVIVAAADDAVFALAADTGETLWTTKLTGRVDCSPVTDGEQVYLLSGAGLALALQWETGEESWRLPIEGAGGDGPAVLDETSLYLGNGERLLVVDRRTGDLQWSFDAGFKITSIAMDGGLVFLSSRIYAFIEQGEHIVAALDVATRPRRGAYWSRTFGDTIYADVTARNGTLYVGCRDRRLYAINVRRADTGPVRAAEIWRRIGAVHARSGERRKAVAALEQAIELNPADAEGHRELAEAYLEAGRYASAIVSQQRYVELVQGEPPEPDARARLAKLSGLQWTAPSPRLMPSSLFPGTLVGTDEDLSPITPGPLATADAVYVGGSDGIVRRLDRRTGEVIWARDVGDEQSVRTTPALADGRLFVGSRRGLHALDAATGQELWHVASDRRVDSSPCIAGGVLYAGGDDGVLRALDARTGTLRWAFEAPRPIKARPAVDRGLVCFGAYDGGVYALAENDGRLRWRFQTDDILNSSPALAGGHVFIGADDGRLYALDLLTGDLVWKYRVEEQERSALRYGIASGGGITSLGFLPSTPVVVGDLLVAGSNGQSPSRLYGLNAHTGKLAWSYQVENGEVGSPAIWRDVVLVGAGGVVFHDPYIYALETRDGSLLWRFRTAGDVLSAPAVVDDEVVCWCTSGDVYSFRIGQIAQQTSERDAAFYRARGSVLAGEARHPEAIRVLLEGRAEYPKDLDMLVALADEYQEAGRTREQRDTLIEVQRLDRSSTTSYWRLGSLYLSQGDAAGAIEQFNTYIRRQTEGAKPLGHFLLGTARAATGDTEGALAAWKTGITSAAAFLSRGLGSSSDRDAAIEALALLSARVALTLFAQGEPVQRAFDAQVLHQLDESDREAAKRSACPAVVRAILVEQTGEAARADELYALALASEDGADYVVEVASILHDRLHRFDQACEVYGALLQRLPDRVDLRLNAAEAALNAGRPEVYPLTEAACAGDDLGNALGAHVLRLLAALGQADAAGFRTELDACTAALTRMAGHDEFAWDFGGTRFRLEHGTLEPDLRDWALRLLGALTPFDRSAVAALLQAPPVHPGALVTPIRST